MIGVGTDAVQLDRNEAAFSSLLGEDKDSWGLSYSGQFHHNNEVTGYSPRFSQGSIIGVHLDLWLGKISYYHNRKPLGPAETSLQFRGPVYPMLCSTAARSSMRLLTSCSFSSSLQFLCCVQLRKQVPPSKHVLEAISLPPGLESTLKTSLNWLLRPNHREKTSFKRVRTDSSSDSDLNCKKSKEHL